MYIIYGSVQNMSTYETYNGAEVDGLVLQDDLVSQPFVLGVPLEQAPIHTQIPVACEDGRNDGCDDRHHPQHGQIAVVRKCLSQS